jgi:5-methylthioadenosine/S-adenosylhomocysteine deaminase
MASLVIERATLLPMGERMAILPNHYLIIRDGSIQELGEGAPPESSIPAGARRIDAAGRVVMPGLINTHTHSYQTLLRGAFDNLSLLPWLSKLYNAGAALRPEDCLISAQLAALELIRSGTTAVCDHHFTNQTVDHPAGTTEGLLSAGLRVVIARTVMDGGELVPPILVETAEQAFRDTDALMRRFSSVPSDMLRFMTGPNTPPVASSPHLCRACREYADHHHIGISSHIAEACGVLDLTRRQYGAGGVVELVHRCGLTGKDSVFAHVVHVSPYEIRLLAETGTSVAHNPVSNMLLGDGVAPVTAMLAAGVAVGLGTDGAASNHTLDMFQTMKFASLLQRVHHLDPQIITPYAVIRMATHGSAKALGLERLCGTLEPGKKGDVIIVDLNSHPRNIGAHHIVTQLVHVAQSADVTHTIVNGQVLMDERCIMSLDEQAVMTAARCAASELLQRIQ